MDDFLGWLFAVALTLLIVGVALGITLRITMWVAGL